MDGMDTLQYVVTRLKECGKGELGAVAKEAGVPSYSLYRIRKGTTANPGIKTVEALRAYFAAKDAQ